MKSRVHPRPGRWHLLTGRVATMRAPGRAVLDFSRGATVLNAAMRCWLGGAWLIGFTYATAEPVDFDRDIRPILSDTCFHCHGPDSAKRKADLRLDTETGAKGAIDGRFPIVPGDPASSEIYRRLISSDPDEM